MLEEHYPFVAQPLPYEYDALLPVLDEETLHFHHDKHYQTYVDKLNAILADYPQLQQMTLTELLTSEDNKLASLQEEAFTITEAAYTPISCILTACEALWGRNPAEHWKRH